MCSGRPLIRLAHAGRPHRSGRSTVRPPPPPPSADPNLEPLAAEWRGGCCLKSGSVSFHLWRRGAIHLPPPGWVWGYQAIRCAVQNSPAIFKTLFSPLRIRENTHRAASAGQALCQTGTSLRHLVRLLPSEAACVHSSPDASRNCSAKKANSYPHECQSRVPLHLVVFAAIVTGDPRCQRCGSF